MAKRANKNGTDKKSAAACDRQQRRGIQANSLAGRWGQQTQNEVIA
jgi:hypothetical protein